MEFSYQHCIKEQAKEQATYVKCELGVGPTFLVLTPGMSDRPPPDSYTGRVSVDKSIRNQ